MITASLTFSPRRLRARVGIPKTRDLGFCFIATASTYVLVLCSLRRLKPCVPRRHFKSSYQKCLRVFVLQGCTHIASQSFPGLPSICAVNTPSVSSFGSFRLSVSKSRVGQRPNPVYRKTNKSRRKTAGFPPTFSDEKVFQDWLRNKETLALFSVLAEKLSIISNKTGRLTSDSARLSATHYAESFPGLITVKQGSPANGGGTWLHPDLAMQLAQWCDAAFALRVSRWVREAILAETTRKANQSSWNKARENGMEARREFTDAIQDYKKNLGS